MKMWILKAILAAGLLIQVLNQQIRNLNFWLGPFHNCHLHIVNYHKGLDYSEFRVPVILEDVAHSNVFKLYSGSRDRKLAWNAQHYFVGNSRYFYNETKKDVRGVPLAEETSPKHFRWNCLAHVIIIQPKSVTGVPGGNAWARLPLPASLVNYFLPSGVNSPSVKISWPVGEVLRSGQYFLFFSREVTWTNFWLNAINSHLAVGQNTRTLVFKMRTIRHWDYYIRNMSSVEIAAFYTCRPKNKNPMMLCSIATTRKGYKKSFLDARWLQLEKSDTCTQWKIGDAYVVRSI